MGSLFRAREWWSTTCGMDEEFDVGCMCTGNVDNEPSGSAKLVAGSYSGMLRMFHPQKRDYDIGDLMLEQSLGEPILQIAVGRFTKGSMDFSLAVLQPRKLSVHACIAVGDGMAANEKQYFQLNMIYEHVFERTAANFCFGPFGIEVAPGHRPPMLDDICVQSMDGCLHFFNQEVASFKRFLPKFLLPGVLIYAPLHQSFITASSHMLVCCYKHQMLASSVEGQAAVGPAVDAAAVGKKLQATWEANVGEHVLDIKVARFSKSLAQTQTDILVLGEHTLFCLNNSGEIRMQKRLEYVPGCLCPYPQSVDRDGIAKDNLLIASAMPPKISVYSEEKLEWVCGLRSVPVCLEVCQFGALKGLITTVDQDGNLAVNYLGTDPPNSIVTTGDKTELNYEEMDVEHRKLLTVIREATSDMREEPKDRVMLRAEMPTRLDAAQQPPQQDGESGWRSRVVSARLIVSYTGLDVVENLQIEVAASAPVVVDQDLFTIESLQGGSRTPLIIPIQVRMRDDMLPSNMELPIIATYLTAKGEPRTARWDIQLPLCLVCTIVPPVKNADFKVTIDTNQPPPQLTSVFEDVVAQSALGANISPSSAVNVLTFQYFCGMDVTVLVSKSSNRYRLQSNQFHAVWLILNVLSTRLIQYFQGARGGGGVDGGGSAVEPFEVGFKDTLPLPEYFAVIEQHLMARHSSLAIAKQLADRSAQFRAVQKRLLVRFKDRNPAPLDHLETLLSGTYSQLLELSRHMQQAQRSLQLTSNVLACATRLITVLLRFQHNLDSESFDVLCSYLSADVADTPEQGWEETTDAALTSMLRSALSKKDMVSNIVQLEEALVIPADAEKLKKHIAIMCDRLGKTDTDRLAMLKQKDSPGPPPASE